MSRAMHALAASPLVRAAAVATAVAVVLGLGVFGLGHGGRSETNLDTRYLYLAGKYWMAGDNAYAPTIPLHDVGGMGDAWEQYNYAYPPQATPLCLLLALGSLPLSFAIMNALNLAAIAVLAWLGVRTIEEPGPDAVAPSTSTAHRWFVPALMAGNLSTAFALWMGQTTLIVTAALAGAWYAAARGRWVVAGALLALGTCKPPLALFVVCWFVLARDWRALAVMSAVVLLASVLPFVVVGPVAVWFEWLHAVGRYGNHAFNSVGTRMLFNLRSLLYAAGVHVPDLFVLGFVATGTLWWLRRELTGRDVLGLLLGVALLFGYAHSYDLAALAVLVPLFWRHLHRRPAASVVALGLLVAITFPNSMLERFHSELLLHARVALVVAALAWLVGLSAAEVDAETETDAAQVAGAADARCFPSTSRIP